MVLRGTERCCIVLRGVAWCCVVACGVARHHVVQLRGRVL